MTMFQNLSGTLKITKVAAATAAGTTAINSSSVDMTNYEGVLFLVTALAITAGGVQSINAATSSDDSTFNDLLGTGVTIADDDDNETFWIEIYKPLERYLRLEVARATQNSAFGEIYAFQYGNRKEPISNNVAATITGELHISPAEGTA